MAKFRFLKYLIILLLTINQVFGDLTVENPQKSPRIVNGENVKISKHPYIVSVHRKRSNVKIFEPYCSGTIYNDDTIITAANCVRNIEPLDLLIVAGSSLRTGFLKDGGMVFPVKQTIINQDNTIDLAIVRLALKLPLSNNFLTMQAVTIASFIPPSGTSAVTVGWGRVKENGDYSEHLLEATVPLLNQSDCLDVQITENEICAGNLTNGGSYTCQGDAGGPLMANDQMIGVTSWAVGCANPDKPNVYTNVVKLNNWIVNELVAIRIDFL